MLEPFDLGLEVEMTRTYLIERFIFCRRGVIECFQPLFWWSSINSTKPILQNCEAHHALSMTQVSLQARNQNQTFSETLLSLLQTQIKLRKVKIKEAVFSKNIF
jgi:hypothetical protein